MAGLMAEPAATALDVVFVPQLHGAAGASGNNLIRR
jgi:hypothetical protein